MFQFFALFCVCVPVERVADLQCCGSVTFLYGSVTSFDFSFVSFLPQLTLLANSWSFDEKKLK
jgi:hypothetical protein